MIPFPKIQGVVMEFNEWLRIRNGLKKAEDEAMRREKKVREQQALQEMSKSLVKNWENTIEVCPGCDCITSSL